MFLINSRLWRTYGVEIVINKADITSKLGCEELIRVALNLGPVEGIFNLAVALRDGIFENQDKKMFSESLGPKAYATKYLDEISRRLCPTLKHFVIFSSVSCGRGNAGQSNYGMGNSIMERIMEQRQLQGLPGKAIQWGAIGDVGLLADLQENNMDMEISGTLPQRITSCLEVLDTLLNVNEPIVASMIVAEKRFEDVKKGNIVDAVLNIMSIRDKKSISMDASLSRLGMDSLMGVEIQQILERDYDVVISSQEMRSLTLSQLEKRVNSKDSAEATNMTNGDLPRDLEFLLASFGDEATSDKTILKLKSLSDSGSTKVLIIPGFEGMAGDVWHGVAKCIKYPTYILQLGNATEIIDLKGMFDAVSKVSEPSSINELDIVLKNSFQDILELFSGKENFYLIGYSFGSLLTLEIAKMLELEGKKGSVTIIDGSPQFIHKVANQIVPENTDENIQSVILLTCIRLLFPKEYHEIAENVFANSAWESRLKCFTDVAKERSQYSAEYGSRMLTALINRLKISIDADKLSLPKLSETSINLIRPTESSTSNFDEDYGLGKYCSQEVKVNVIEGNHASMLSNPELTNLLNK